jgi:hypothetical protein
MSCSAKRHLRRAHADCSCGNRAVYFRPGARAEVCARRDHPLCGRCWRAARGRETARQMRAAYARRVNYVAGPFALL